MISEKLLKLYHTALQMETLLQSSTKQYRAMYNALEHDLDIALDGVAMRMIEKYNIPDPNKDRPDHPSHDGRLFDDEPDPTLPREDRRYALPDEGSDPVPEDNHDSSD